MPKYDEANGVWRTIGGRKVFIKTGQSLSEAMIESGKFKNMRSDYKKAKEEEAKKNVTSEKAIDELMNADVGDWNNMNQSQRDKVCEDILKGFEEKYGSKLEDAEFRKEVLDGLEDQNFHTMGKIIEQKYEDGGYEPLKQLNEKINKAENDDYVAFDKKMQANIDRVNKEYDEEMVKARQRGDAKLEEKAKEKRIAELKKYQDMKDENYANYQQARAKANQPAGEQMRQLIKENNVKTFGDEIEQSKKRTGVDSVTEEIARNVDENYPEIAKKVEDRYYNSQKQAAAELGYDVNTNNAKEWREIRERAEEIREEANSRDLKINDLKTRKENYKKDIESADTQWANLYDKQDFGNKEWSDELDSIREKGNKARENYKNTLQEYFKVADEKDLTWQDKVAKNDFERDDILEDLKEKRQSDIHYRMHPDEWSDKYYGTFEDYEKKNAKIKAESAKPEDAYEYTSSYYSMTEKNHKLSGDKFEGKDVVEFGNNSWTGKDYTNDEFIDHLENANWHKERRMLLTAGLTNQEMTYIKDRVKLDSYGANIDPARTQQLIDEAKKKYRSTNNKMNSMLREKAYNKYKKEHPNTKKTLQDFIK